MSALTFLIVLFAGAGFFYTIKKDNKIDIAEKIDKIYITISKTNDELNCLKIETMTTIDKLKVDSLDTIKNHEVKIATLETKVKYLEHENIDLKQRLVQMEDKKGLKYT